MARDFSWDRQVAALRGALPQARDGATSGPNLAPARAAPPSRRTCACVAARPRDLVPPPVSPRAGPAPRQCDRPAASELGPRVALPLRDRDALCESWLSPPVFYPLSRDSRDHRPHARSDGRSIFPHGSPASRRNSPIRRRSPCCSCWPTRPPPGFDACSAPRRVRRRSAPFFSPSRRRARRRSTIRSSPPSLALPLASAESRLRRSGSGDRPGPRRRPGARDGSSPPPPSPGSSSPPPISPGSSSSGSASPLAAALLAPACRDVLERPSGATSFRSAVRACCFLPSRRRSPALPESPRPVRRRDRFRRTGRAPPAAPGLLAATGKARWRAPSSISEATRSRPGSTTSASAGSRSLLCLWDAASSAAIRGAGPWRSRPALRSRLVTSWPGGFELWRPFTPSFPAPNRYAASAGSSSFFSCPRRSRWSPSPAKRDDADSPGSSSAPSRSS